KGFAHLGRLPGLKDVALQIAAAERVADKVVAAETVDEIGALGDRQFDRLVDRRIADHRLRIAPVLDRLEIVEKAAADHHDATVARRQVLLRAVGDRPLPDPGDKILVHHVAGDPSPGLRIGYWTGPGRDAVLDIGLALLWHPTEMPHHR